MSEKAKYVDDLAAIRSVMERSTRYLSLSGLSSILAGIYALVGLGIGYQLIFSSSHSMLYEDLVPGVHTEEIFVLAAIALGVLFAALVTAIYLSYRKARADGQSLFNRSAIRLMINFAIPFGAGSIFVLLLFQAGYFLLLAPSMLLFYGLALLNAGNFTFSDIRQLGIGEIILGLLAAAFPAMGLFFWALGFGVLHMVYGLIIYLKYER